MNRRGPVIFNFRKGFFFDRNNDNFIPRRTRRIKHEQRKLAIAGDETETCHKQEPCRDSCSRVVTGLRPVQAGQSPATTQAGILSRRDTVCSAASAELRSAGQPRAVVPTQADAIATI